MLVSLALALISAMLIAAGLYVSMGYSSQAWSESRSESALLLAEGGVNDEISLIGSSIGVPISSPPTVATGTTMTYPGESHMVYGRQGSISGSSTELFWVCTTQNEWWRSGATPVAWDGTSSTFWVTGTAFVNNSWRRVEVQLSKRSVFTQYAVFATDMNGTSDNIVDVGATASAVITGGMGTNGKVNLNGGSGLSLGNAINANTALCTSTQFTSGSVRGGSLLVSQAAPITFATTSSTMKLLLGIPNFLDISAWAYLLLNNNNATGIYTYKFGAASATLSPTNCRSVLMLSTALTNYALLPTSKGWWDQGNVKPGTSSKVKTLIFEPGDYYLTDVDLNYDPSTEIVIDPMALASGGTPGQIRFWVYSTTIFGGIDTFDLPIQMTKASGASTPDPSLFRINYSRDGGTLSFDRPANIKDYNGATLTGDFNLYGSIYSVTKPVNDTNPLLYGSKIVISGSSGGTNGKYIVNGSVIADRIGFQGPCAVTYVNSSHTADPSAGAIIQGSYYDGK